MEKNKIEGVKMLVNFSQIRIKRLISDENDNEYRLSNDEQLENSSIEKPIRIHYLKNDNKFQENDEIQTALLKEHYDL